MRVFSVEAGADLTDKAGSIVAAVQGWQAEAFLDGLREKTRRGMRGQVERGLSAGGRAYGYRSVPICDESRKDSYGQPLVTGYRRVVDKAEARVVGRIFKMYASGLSPKTIAHRLNDGGVPPPRWRRGAPNLGWTMSTINGSPERGVGILNNPLYIGRVIWDKSAKARDPDTGKRVMRPRPKSEWVVKEVPELRVVSDELWGRAQAKREAARESFRRHHRKTCGRPPRYLLSGLLVCGECGAHYVKRSGEYYGCASTVNRGSAICENTRLTRRDVAECEVLRYVQEQVFSPEAMRHLTAQVSAALRRMRGATGTGRRSRQEGELAQARERLENVKAAILDGIRTPTTRAMLEEWEGKVAHLESSLSELPDAAASEVRASSSAIKRRLGDLRRVLARDTERSREILRDLLGEIKLEPDDEGLVAVLRGSVSGVLGLSCNNGGAGRGI